MSMTISEKIDVMKSMSTTFKQTPALQRKKEYGNKDEYEYVDWLAQFADLGGACSQSV